MFYACLVMHFDVASVDKRDDESAENKALFLGSTLTMDYHGLTEYLRCNDPAILEDVPEF